MDSKKTVLTATMMTLAIDAVSPEATAIMRKDKEIEALTKQLYRSSRI